MAEGRNFASSSQVKNIRKLEESVKQLQNLVLQQRGESVSNEWEDDVLDPMEKDGRGHHGSEYGRGRGRGRAIGRGRGVSKPNRGRNNRSSNWRTNYPRGGDSPRNWREECGSDSRSLSPPRSGYFSSLSGPPYSPFHSPYPINSSHPNFYVTHIWSPLGPRNHHNYYESDVESLGTNTLDGVSSVSHKDSSVSPSQLAKILSECENFQSTLLSLIDEHNLSHRYVRDLVSVAHNVFEIEEETVYLCPKIELCHDHMVDGCQSLKTCTKLHICSKYMTKNCSEKTCLLGHDFYTNHNKKILSNFNLSLLPVKSLLKLLSPNVSQGNLKICENYNAGECQEENCSEAHLCLKNLANCCLAPECQLSHSISKGPLKSLLESNGIPTNECPRDILLHISLCPLVKDQIEALKSKMKSSDGVADGEAYSKKGKKDDEATTAEIPTGTEKEEEVPLRTVWSNEFKGEVTIAERCFASLVKDQIEALKSKMKSSDGVADGEAYSKKGKKDDEATTAEIPTGTEKEEEVPLRTVWSNEFKGEVTIDEICFASVEGFCPYEEKGCWRLHCDLHFHWQVRSTKTQKSFWVNLAKEQVIALEKAYVRPEVDVVDLPLLDTGSLGPNLKGLLVLLSGRSKWKADFNSMSLKRVGPEVLDLRRLCTQVVSDQIIEACIFKWYFLDKNNEWVEYGQVDTTGKEKLKCNVDSAALEKQYKQKATTLQFNSQSFTYSLDFDKMCQKNLKTNVVREVRRRPMSHFKEENISNLKSDLPLFWESMVPEERVRRVVLPHSSDEYQKITSFVQAQGGLLIILKIERVQNPYLWKAFQNKVEELSMVYKNKAIVDVRQLFHGTKPDVVPKICMENFDWRLHGTSAGQSYGRGSYFSPFPRTSERFTAPDIQGNRYMFIAQVAVGTTSVGNAGMARPPINPTYQIPYDSTVDRIHNPNIIVKYDKQEYFPEYIITYI